MNWTNLHDIIDWCKKNTDKVNYYVGEIKIASISTGFRVTILYVPSLAHSAVLPRKCMRYTVNTSGEIVKKEELFLKD